MIADNIRTFRERLTRVCARAGRDPQAIRIVAASKYTDAAGIREAIAAGIAEFGENRLQDAQPKIAALGGASVQWHYMGRIQSNKLRGIFENFAWVQSVDRESLMHDAQELLESLGQTRNVLLQVNISREAAKGGFEYDALRKVFTPALLAAVPRLRVCGLMGMAPLTDDTTAARRVFKEFKVFFESLRKVHPSMNVLSMGMSEDFEEAVEEGSTMIRIGRALFGEKA